MGCGVVITAASVREVEVGGCSSDSKDELINVKRKKAKNCIKL